MNTDRKISITINTADFRGQVDEIEVEVERLEALAKRATAAGVAASAAMDGATLGKPGPEFIEALDAGLRELDMKR